MQLSPLSKSTYKTALICPWKANAHKNLGFESVSGPAAEDGKEVHSWLEKLLKGETTLDAALRQCSNKNVKWLLQRAVDRWDDVIRSLPVDILVERHIYVNQKGKPVNEPEKAVIHGICDLIVPYPEEGRVVILDWKTGKWEMDDVFERHMYAGCLARSMFPDLPTVQFKLAWIRSGHEYHSEYQWGDDGNTCTVLTPKKKVQAMSGTKNPVFEWMEANLRKIRRMRPVPQPGPHCENWYGKPCQFFGAECPLSANMEVILDSEEFRPFDFYVAIQKARSGELTAENVSDAYLGAMQLRATAKWVEEKITAWSQNHGDFIVGDTPYGWSPTENHAIDDEFCLQTMLDSEMTTEEIAKCLGISRDSLNTGLNERKYSHVRDAIFSIGVEAQQGAPEFGAKKTSPVAA